MATKLEIREAKRKGITFEEARQDPKLIENARKQKSQKPVNQKSKEFRKSASKNVSKKTR